MKRVTMLFIIGFTDIGYMYSQAHSDHALAICAGFTMMLLLLCAGLLVQIKNEIGVY